MALGYRLNCGVVAVGAMCLLVATSCSTATRSASTQSSFSIPPTRLDSLYYCDSFEKAARADQLVVVRYLVSVERLAVGEAFSPPVDSSSPSSLSLSELAGITDRVVADCASAAGRVSVSSVVASLRIVAGVG